jgi:Domain of unknown function (DUF5658)
VITPIDTTSTPFLPWFLFFLMCAFEIVAVVGDSITTMVGLGANKGFVEGNPLMSWLFKKVGQSFAGWLTGVAALAVSLALVNVNYKAGVVATVAIAAAESYFAIKNYLLLKKLGISL